MQFAWTLYTITNYPVLQINFLNNTSQTLFVQFQDNQGNTISYNLVVNPNAIVNLQYTPNGFINFGIGQGTGTSINLQKQLPTQVILNCTSIMFYDQNNQLIPKISQSLSLC